jgi:hypothetical protein
MKIYQFNLDQWFENASSGISGADAWTFTHGTLDLTSKESATLSVTAQSTQFNQGGKGPMGGNFIEIGGDNAPVENVDPILVPGAVKGDVAIWFDRDLTTAEQELSEYEYMMSSNGMYLVWGVLNVSKTDFYTPLSEGFNAVYINTDDTSSNF